MAVRMRIKSPFPTGYKNIVLSGKGRSRVAGANGVLFDRVPFEDPHELTVTKGYVDVLVGEPSDPKPELDLGGVWQLAENSVSETFNGNTLVILEKVEWARNRYT